MRNICDVRRVDRVRNAIIRERCGSELNVLERIESNSFRACGNNGRGKVG